MRAQLFFIGLESGYAAVFYEKYQRHCPVRYPLQGRTADRSRSEWISGALCAGDMRGAGDLTQEQLAQRLHVNRSSVTRQLTLLEKNGFITRQRSADDKRAVEVYPTEKMQRALPIVRDTFLRWRLALTEGLAAQELELLETLLERLACRAQVIR